MRKVNAMLALLVLVGAQIGQSQSFVNLDFESTAVSGPPSTSVPIDAALPGWSGYYSSTNRTLQASQVWYDTVSLGGWAIALIDANTPLGFQPLAGVYSALLFGAGDPLNVSTTLSQTGMVPNGTMSLQAIMTWYEAAPVIKVNGLIINMVPLQTFPHYTLYGGDISSFAGQVVDLSFTEPPPVQGGGPSDVVLDNIVFSSQVVPEPNGFALLTLGGLLLSMRRRRYRSASK
jgi:hypothetical protein